MLICTGDRSFVEKTIFADGLNGFGYEKGYKKLKETLPTWRESNTKGKILINSYLDVLKKISK